MGSARIRSARAGTLGPNPSPQSSQSQQPMQIQATPAPLLPIDPNSSAVDQFIAANRIDHAASVALKNEPPHIQELVLAKGTVSASTNPSASLVARIRVVKEHMNLPPGMQPPMHSMSMAASLNTGLRPNGANERSRSPPTAAPRANVDAASLKDEANKAIEKLGFNQSL